MSKEQQLRKVIREELKQVLKEDNILVKFLTGILDNLGSAAKKRAVKKLLSTPEIQALINDPKPATGRAKNNFLKMAKKWS